MFSHLKEFEYNFMQNGGKVIWAQNSEEAIDSIVKICSKAGATKIVKSKSMATEEIELNHEDQHFEKPAWVTVEVTDDGRYTNSSLAVHPFKNWDE